jgi:hypothetical protein
MCQNAAKTAAGLMSAIEPSLKALLAATGQTSTPLGVSILASYNAALTALQGWTPGTPVQDVLQVVTAFQDLFATLPLPAPVELFGNIILAGIAAVLGILVGNSPAPAAPAGIVPHENVLAAHQVETAVNTAAQVAALVPGFKRSIWHSPESQYKSQWNKAVDANPNAGVVKI